MATWVWIFIYFPGHFNLLEIHFGHWLVYIFCFLCIFSILVLIFRFYLLFLFMLWCAPAAVILKFPPIGPIKDYLILSYTTHLFKLYEDIKQGCQTNFHTGPHQHYGCPQKYTLLPNLLLNNYFCICVQIVYTHLYKCKNIYQQMSVIIT